RVLTSAVWPKTCPRHLVMDLFSWLATRAGEPGCWRCVHRLAFNPSSAFPRVVRPQTAAPMRLESTRESAGMPSRSPLWSTKTRFEIHTRWCRVRPKRKRLTSNVPIETDAAISPTSAPLTELCRGSSDRGLTFHWHVERPDQYSGLRHSRMLAEVSMRRIA